MSRGTALAESNLPIESPFTTRNVWPKAPSLVSLQLPPVLYRVFRSKSAGTDSASTLHFEPIFVDSETLDLGIERPCREP
jgi:hypothetical protein